MSRILTLVFTLLFNYTYADICTSVGDGDWNSPTTWDCGHAPGDGDTIIIDDGHTVTVTGNEGVYVDMYIEVYGTLHFNNGCKISMDADGEIQIYPNGLISGGNGGSKVVIDGVGLWDGNDADVTGPSYIADGVPPTGGYLPVILNYFTCEYRNNSIVIEWSTASEMNNEMFRIEKSKDALEWFESGFVHGAGNSTSNIQYRFTNTYDIEGYNYYRLVQVDYDGVESVTNVISCHSPSFTVERVEYYDLNGMKFEKNKNHIIVIAVEYYDSGDIKTEKIFLNE